MLLLETTTAAEVATAVDAILQDVACGQLTPAEGQLIIASLESRLRIIEKVEHEALEPGASYQVAQELAGPDRLVGEQTLRHRLRERGLLASLDAGRQMVQVRRTLEGTPRQVLHLKASALLEVNSSASPTLPFQPTGRH